MFFHTIKPSELNDFKMDERHWTLLLVSFCELHANADLFGGFNSTSFKIKYKKFIAILKKLTKEKLND